MIPDEEKIIKSYYEQSAKLELMNQAGHKDIELKADKKLQAVTLKKKKLQNLNKKLVSITEQNFINMPVFKRTLASLEVLSTNELYQPFNNNKKGGKEFINEYIKEVRIKFLKEETEKLWTSIQNLRKKGLFKKGNESLCKKYFNYFNRKHVLRNSAPRILRFKVKFIANFVLNMKLLYSIRCA